MKRPTLIKDLGVQPQSKDSKTKRRFGLYLCECGKEFKAIMSNVKKGNTKSCGCLRIKKIKERSITHGLSNNPLYEVYLSMMARCYKKNSASYKNYGGRGITVCDRWKNNVSNFVQDLNHLYKKGLEINRIDNDGNYELSNVNFVTHKVNSSATRVLKKNNTSGYRGVCKDKKNFRAEITVDYKSIHIGNFNTKLEAAKAYDQYIKDNNLPHTPNGVLKN